MPRIGFVGLGSMGGSMVQALSTAGHTPVVFDLDTAKVAEAVDLGAVAAATLGEVASQCDIVGVCVATDAQVRSVLEGELLDGLRPGAVITLHSTVLPETVTWAADTAASREVGFVEAPVTGGPAAAAEGRLTFLLSGAAEDIAAADVLFEACATARVDAGPVGKANLLKLCVNLQTFVTHLAIAEAASLARTFDVSLAGLKAAMDANGQLGELSAGYFSLQELPDELLDDPGLVAMREPLVAVIAKDIGHMQSMAASVGAEVPAVDVAAGQLTETYRMPGRRGSSPPAATPG